MSEKFVALDNWAGRRLCPCEIVGQTQTRFKVRLKADALLPGGRHTKAGETVVVPKYAVIEQEVSR